MGEYVKNLETSKIELHFDKSEYLALSDSQKSDIKSAFLWSSREGAWVSRSTNNHYRAMDVAKKIGLDDGGETGEKLSFAEQIERKVEKAETRAERYEEHADKAEHRAEALQSEFDSHQGDIAYFTQPNINSSGGRAFTNQRNRVIAKFEHGMEEHQKADFYREKVAIARETASLHQLNDKVYLDNRIKEHSGIISKLQKRIEECESKIKRIEGGEIITSWETKQPFEVSAFTAAIERTNERIAEETDKLDYFRAALDALGGVTYSKANVKVGDGVKIRGGWCVVKRANPTTVTVINQFGWDWMKYPYSEIQEYKDTKKW